MTIEIVTNVHTLMRLAKTVGDARQSEDAEALAKAEAELQAYERAVLNSDRMML